MNPPPNQRIALVTGANCGIGLYLPAISRARRHGVAWRP
jgi:NAD(P)-dependent dehydrogenase (short-subunit alcohol dehydrogenase family)